MILKNFQNKAINELERAFLTLWKEGKSKKIPLVFKSPTGSGKTIMMAEFLKQISNTLHWSTDKAFVWLSFSEDSYAQSRQKLFHYYNSGVCNLTLRDMNVLKRKYLRQNEIFFINWQKLVSRSKENRKLRNNEPEKFRPSFDTFIKNTHAKNREIILIVDEAHIAKDTELSQEIIDLINPKIEIHITATPKKMPSIEEVQNFEAGFVSVNRRDVVEEGLIKENIEVMPLEEIEKIQKEKSFEDQDDLLLDLAFVKKKELKKHYEELGVSVNPLVLIQLPNDDKEKDATQENKLEIIKQYLIKKGVEKDRIAIWLSDKKENLGEITKLDSEIDFLIFKQAAATGWDCPRAQVLVMFREVKSPTFKTQVIGRVLRMPEAKHYSISALNKAYLYTNYESNQIEVANKKLGENKLKIYKSYRKNPIDLKLDSVFLKRASYGDLGDSFQQTFFDTANELLGLKGNEIFNQAEKILNQKGLDLEKKITNSLIVNAHIESYDDFTKELEESTETLQYEASRHDIEKTYNLLLYRELAIQQEENKKYAPERSWGKLKSAMNVFFKSYGIRNPALYRIVCADLLRDEQSILRKVISEALGMYKPIREQEEQKRVEKSREDRIFQILDFYSFSDDYEEKKVNKSILEPFYIQKEYRGKDNEGDFIDFLDQGDIEWWFKNGDYGRDFFAIEYTDEKGRKNLFYPDFIVQCKDGRIGIFDSKAGMTAKEGEAKPKAEALQRFIREENKKGKNLWGGLVVKVGGLWKVNVNEVYEFDEKDLRGWVDLGF